MFGYVRINKMDLTFREFDYYKGYYCGLCKYLKENHGEVSRLSLNYDITFLIVILTALYKLDSDITYERCIANPLKKKMRIVNEITEYAASMNILLSYYKLEDNLYDDNTIKDKLAYAIYKGKLKSAYEKYPEKAEYIKQQLLNLRELENEKSIEIDKLFNNYREDKINISKINEEAAIEIEEVPSQEKPITTNNISTSLDNNLEEKLSKSIKEENLLPDMMQLDFNMLEKESLLKDIANIEVMTMTPLDAMNTLFKIVQDAKKLK